MIPFSLQTSRAIYRITPHHGNAIHLSYTMQYTPSGSNTVGRPGKIETFLDFAETTVSAQRSLYIAEPP